MFNGGKISYWRLNQRSTVYPHLELDQRPYSQKEMRNICDKLKEELTNLNIVIYEESTYCNELNGQWNVCFAVSDLEKGISYTYLIRRCQDFKKTFGCPFINTDYIYGLNITGLMKETNNKFFDIIEKKLIELCPNSKKIDYFDT